MMNGSESQCRRGCPRLVPRLSVWGQTDLHTRLRFVLVLFVATFWTSTSNAQDIFDQREQKLVSGLRDRALYDLAESHCQRVLNRDGLTPTDYASVAIERIRIATTRARTASDRQPYWQSVETITKEFATAHSGNPKTVLVGFQQAMAHVSFANLLQQELQAKIGDERSRRQGLEQLTRARSVLDRTKQSVMDLIKSQVNKTLTSDMLSGDQLRTLKTNLEYQQAVVNLTSAQLTDTSNEAGKLDQIDSLGRVPAQLASVRGAVAQSRSLWWETWIREATCRRMQGEIASADQILTKLAKLGNRTRPKSVDAMLLRERVELEIANGDRNRMQRLAKSAIGKRHDAETEIALIRLMVAAGEIENASQLAGKVAGSHGPWWARRADIALLSGNVSGNASVDTAATTITEPAAVNAAGARMLLEAAEKAEKNGDYEAAEKGYAKVAQSLFSSGDRSGGLATIVRAATVLEKESKHQQAAEVLLKHAKAYAGEKIAASIHLRGCWNLSKAKSSQFGRETAAHIKQWPDAESSNQARYWLASQQLADNEYAQAFKTLAATQPNSPNFPAAVKLARYACRKQLLAAESKGSVTRPLARQMIPRWKEVYAACQQTSKPMVAVAMAELASGWKAEDTSKALSRLKDVAEIPSAKSDPEFKYLLALLSNSRDSKRYIASANKLPFDAKVVAQMLRLLDRQEDSKHVGELKLAIAEDSLAKTKDVKVQNMLMFAKAKALETLGKKFESRKILKELVRTDSRNLKVQIALAEVSDRDEAIGMWRSIASRTSPQSSAWFQAKYNVARLMHEMGKSSEAEKMLKYIKAVPPGWADSKLRDKFEKLLRDCGG